jgi:hypothetical protein
LSLEGEAGLGFPATCFAGAQYTWGARLWKPGSVESALKRVVQATVVAKYSVVDLVESAKSRFKAGTGLEEQAPWVILTVDKLKELHLPPSHTISTCLPVLHSTLRRRVLENSANGLAERVKASYS